MARLILGKSTVITGTVNGITIYKMRGEFYIRAKSSLSGKRVKTSPAFQQTMLHADILARASRIASFIYKQVQATVGNQISFRDLTSEAIRLIKAGTGDDETKEMLSKIYLN